MIYISFVNFEVIFLDWVVRSIVLNYQMGTQFIRNIYQTEDSFSLSVSNKKNQSSILLITNKTIPRIV